MAFINISDNIINVFNEVIIMGSFTSVLFMNLIDTSESFEKILGWILIILIGIFLAITWGITLPDLFIDLWKSVRKACKCKKANKIKKRKGISIKTSPAVLLKADNDFKKPVVVKNIKTERDVDSLSIENAKDKEID